MNGYCNQCENHCAIDDLHCRRGYNAYEAGEDRGNEVQFRGDREGGFRTLPAFPGERPAEGRRDRGHGGGFPHDCGPRGFGGRPGDPGEFDGHGRHGGPGGPGGMPPHGGRPPFGRPPRPMPDGEMLRERIAEASLSELMELAGRMMHHRPGAGSARGQNLILSILAGREALSQRELQQMLGVQPGSMSEIVSKLERKGLLTREKGEDRRGNLLRITEDGRRAIPQAEAEPEDERFAALTAEQRDTLADLLRTLLNDWTSRVEDAPRTLPAHPQAPDGRFRTLEAHGPEAGRGVET